MWRCGKRAESERGGESQRQGGGAGSRGHWGRKSTPPDVHLRRVCCVRGWLSAVSVSSTTCSPLGVRTKSAGGMLSQRNRDDVWTSQVFSPLLGGGSTFKRTTPPAAAVVLLTGVLVLFTPHRPLRGREQRRLRGREHRRRGDRWDNRASRHVRWVRSGGVLWPPVLR